MMKTKRAPTLSVANVRPHHHHEQRISARSFELSRKFLLSNRHLEISVGIWVQLVRAYALGLSRAACFTLSKQVRLCSFGDLTKSKERFDGVIATVLFIDHF